MPQEQPDNEQLHFWSFIDHAITRTTGELPDVDPVAMRLVLSLHRAANMLVYDLESTVHRPRGWSWPGFRVLFVVWLTGPVEAKKVAELSGMSRAAVSALVATLEKDGLLTKERAPHDGRAVHLRLTEEGRSAITEAFRAHNAREQEWAGSLSQDEQLLLITLLEKLTAHSVHFDARHRA
ncbi:MarR family winged helix-turn-helix transcriptional regulator [Streptomyces diastatochromogenes]|uniref:MarR family transcriptional regulator n=1 Tax=Streptomyces diastatochromogenes TaxID=42236 RepID=A0A233RQQ1_STRDA|nr:MarR family transcriptional regulator [Streptomyces diastatochromogenes]MCZ0984741.1 MarR family transcriptional regulator [Streptomyces diastatochromogenes]OXY85725.1 MarR family transcriptional regulator [Streptomyces diastatochromogenes]